MISWCFSAGMMPMQQQGFPMVSVMQPNMQGMIGMNYSSQMSQGPIAMQVLASFTSVYRVIICCYLSAYQELHTRSLMLYL